ncbi:hypothetical protein QOT17_003330 [Balamuthia mandrillaris]
MKKEASSGEGRRHSLAVTSSNGNGSTSGNDSGSNQASASGSLRMRRPSTASPVLPARTAAKASTGGGKKNSAGEEVLLGSSPTRLLEVMESSNANQKSNKSPNVSGNLTSTASLRKVSKKEMDQATILSVKFGLPEEDVSDPVKPPIHCVWHTGILHHGNLYIFPNFVCFASSSNRIKKTVAFSEISAIELQPHSIRLTYTKDNKERKCKVSHFTHRIRTFKILYLVWRYAQGDTSINLDEIRANKTLKDISLESVSKSTNARGEDWEEGEGEVDDLASSIQESEIELPPTSPESVEPMPPNYEKPPTRATVFPISIAKFWHLFFSNDSNHAVEAHEKNGDHDITMGQWTKSEEGGKPHLVRILDVSLDVKSKIVKGVCKVHQTQKAYMTPEGVLIMFTCSEQSGVPYSADFNSRSMWECKEMDGQTDVKIWGYIEWKTKPPLVKSIVEKGSIKGMTDYTDLWMEMAYQKLKPKPRRGSSSTNGENSAEEDEDTSPSSASSAAPGASSHPSRSHHHQHKPTSGIASLFNAAPLMVVGLATFIFFMLGMSFVLWMQMNSVHNQNLFLLQEIELMKQIAAATTTAPPQTIHFPSTDAEELMGTAKLASDDAEWAAIISQLEAKFSSFELEKQQLVQRFKDEILELVKRKTQV